MSEAPSTDLPTNRIKQLTDFITNSSFLCPWGRGSVKSQTAEISVVPRSDSFNKVTNRLIDVMNNGFAQREKDALILVYDDDCSCHTVEYMRAKTMYAATRTAARVIDGKDFDDEVEQSSLIANYFFDNPENFQKQYPMSGKIPFQRDNLMVLAMNPLYEIGHGRHAPVSSWIITRMSDGGKARRSNPASAQKAMLDAWGAGQIPYNVGLPYIMPNDTRFAMPNFLEYLLVAEELLRRMHEIIVPGTTPIQFATVMVRVSVAGIVANENGKAVFDPSNINEETLFQELTSAGILRTDVKFD